jgi:hypothetical protein
MTDVFTSATTENTAPAGDATSQTNDSFVTQLVGEGKKFKDVESLAKGKLEADRHIEEITKTLNELREEVSKQDYAKELLTKLQDKGTDTGTVNPAMGTNTGNSANGNTTQDASTIEALVEQLMTKKEKTRTLEQNIAVANDAVVSQYGDKAAEVVKAKASELGMSVERLKEIAAESPTAFLQLIGAKANVKVDSVTTPSSIRSETLTNTGTDRTFDYYQKLRKDNKSLYYSPKVQRMLMEDRIRLGEKFYKS